MEGKIEISKHLSTEIRNIFFKSSTNFDRICETLQHRIASKESQQSV
jgi:hypothetical protein